MFLLLFAVLIVFFFEFVSYFDIRISYFLPEGHHVLGIQEAAAQAERMEEAVLAAFLDLVEKVGPETAEKWCEVLERVEQVLGLTQKISE